MVTLQRVLRALAKGLDVAADELEDEAPRELPADTSGKGAEKDRFADVSVGAPPAVAPVAAWGAPAAKAPPPAPARPPPLAPLPPSHREKGRAEGAAAYRAGMTRDRNPHAGKLYGLAGALRLGWEEGWDREKLVVAAEHSDERDRADGRRARADGVERAKNPHPVSPRRRDLWWKGWDEKDLELSPVPEEPART